jgi:hypothetical protein
VVRAAPNDVLAFSQDYFAAQMAADEEKKKAALAAAEAAIAPEVAFVPRRKEEVAYHRRRNAKLAVGCAERKAGGDDNITEAAAPCGAIPDIVVAAVHNDRAEVIARLVEDDGHQEANIEPTMEG